MKENRLNRSVLDTPHAKMVVMATAKGLAVLEFIKPNRSEVLSRRLTKYFPGYEIVDNSDGIAAMTSEWLQHYFSREFDCLTVPPLDLRGTDFELKVWQALLRIRISRSNNPRGREQPRGWIIVPTRPPLGQRRPPEPRRLLALVGIRPRRWTAVGPAGCRFTG